MISWWNASAVQKNENPCFREKHEFDWQIPSQNEILMKSWYLLVVLAVISVFAVCRFNTINTSFLRKPFSRRNKNFRLLRTFRISADPASGAYRKHSQASGLPKSVPFGIPRPIFRKKSNGNRFYLFLCVFMLFPYMVPYCCLINSVNSMCEPRRCVRRACKGW